MTIESISPIQPLSIDQIVGERVHRVLWLRKISQSEFAPKLGLSQSGLSRKLRGDRAFGIDELLTIADLLGVDVSDLLPKKVYDDETPPDSPDGVGVSRLGESNPRPFHYKDRLRATVQPLPIRTRKDAA